MSVVFGVVFSSGVMIAADRRQLSLENMKPISEYFDKIFIANHRVAIAAVGSSGVFAWLKEKIENGNKAISEKARESFAVEDYCDIVDICIDQFKKLRADFTSEIDAVWLVAGRSRGDVPIIKWKANGWKGWSTLTPVKGKITPIVLQPRDMSHNEAIKLLTDAIQRQQLSDGDLETAMVEAIKGVSAKSISVNAKVTIWGDDLGKRLVHVG